ncbi:MAG TPA: 50S ribosomal protein L25 [Vicinamibacteria bacterium]|nr:50S ribosomal protein L25 [Vicinamibacteria bacterium]
MPEIVVAAQSRTETGKNVNRRLRTKGLIPGVLYGKAKDPVPVAVSPKEIGTILRSKSGENTLFDLELGGSRRTVILKEFQLEPLKGTLLHADFYEVALDKPLQVNVQIQLLGTPVGVKVQGGIVDWVTRELEIESLPADIPEKIAVDISNLEIGKHLRVADLTAPDRVTILTDAEVVIAHVVAPRAEEAPAAAEAAAPVEEGAAEPEVIKKGKATAEGEAGEEKAADKPEKKAAEKKEKK